MTLADEYRRQARWRAFERDYGRLPNLEGSCVADLGGAVGDQSAAFAARGAEVTGIDLHEELLAAARERAIPDAQFVTADLREPLPLLEPVDGIWSSFAAAYFVDLAPVLRRWLESLRPGGWIALVEIDSLFGREPLPGGVCALLRSYTDAAAEAGVLDAWRQRCEPRTLLTRHCGEQAGYVSQSFLDCLAQADHRSEARVNCCIATRPQI
ncbi:MAG: class I SAM-dependent methyltransferase [Planctomycetes bacterium]|nr:class I SAM-dependent methyltransferase [Planctomycetota bacterium]